jgi:tetratricopeptide (TPR) repeat protein
MGEAYSSMDDMDKAMTEYQSAAKSPVKNNPYRLAALAKMGEYYEKKEAWSSAIEAFGDLARNSGDREWVDAAKARIAADKERLAASGKPADAVDAPAKAPPKAPAKKKQ